MDQGAHLRDTRTIMAAKAILTKAARGFATAIEESRSDAERFGMWLSSEGPTYWERQRRQLTEKLNGDRAALFRKEIQMTADGRPPSTVDERRTVARTEQAVRHAEHCLRELRRWAIEYQRVLALFRAGMGPLSTYVDQVIPASVASLNRMGEAIDSYLSTGPKGLEPELDAIANAAPESLQLPDLRTDAESSMRRGGSKDSTEGHRDE
ncbi:MAG: hypothetical protein EXS15_00135 [Phycisphaerales bacterium]|nr:hypothetical protein [Phycisphaerales bacterium]